MADNLTNNQWKWILKKYWKTENAKKIRQKWAEEFDTPPQVDKHFTEYAINLMKLGPSVMLQKVVNQSVLPVRHLWRAPKNQNNEHLLS